MATGKGIEDLASARPRDLLRLFVREELRGDSEVVEAEEMELSLGLSLGGSFGVEPRDKRLHRSSSISTLSMFPTESDLSAGAAPPLSRTCSMPVDTEEEHRKRKELQSLKRLEAKRKRLEKRRIRSGATTEVKDEILDEGTNGEPGNSVESNGFPGFPTNLETSNKGELPLWAKRGGAATSPISQGSIGSQGSSSTVSNSKQGLEPPLDHKAATMPPAPTTGKPAVISGEGGGPETKTAGRANATREMERSMMEEMPCVSTKGDGPNGRRIEGFLYKYRKGEEVRIVCVCHGSFLTPAEFVKHAGGGDVTHPLRHIVVSPFPATFL